MKQEALLVENVPDPLAGEQVIGEKSQFSVLSVVYHIYFSTLCFEAELFLVCH